MNTEDLPGYMALKHANGMSWADILDLHAHELAEQIRVEARDWSGEQALGLFRAADRIDPEVTNA